MMKTKLVIFGLLTFQGIMSQNIPKNDRILEWADYYFMNQDYDKALSHYLKVGESIPLGSRRNFSSVYAQMGQVNKAAQILRPLVDSDSAIVKDYYNFLSIFINDGKFKGKQIIEKTTNDMIYKNQLTDEFNTSIGLVFGITSKNDEWFNEGKTEGVLHWGGYWNTNFFADNKNKLIALIYKQTQNTSENSWGKFREIIYQSID